MTVQRAFSPRDLTEPCPAGPVLRGSTLDTALVPPRKAFAKCNRSKLNSLCSNTRSLSPCELQAAPPTVRRLSLTATHAD